MAITKKIKQLVNPANSEEYIYPITGTAEQKEYAAVKAAAMWCYYNNDPTLGAVYGKLYNWYAIKLLQMDIDYYNVANPTAPWGWRVPVRGDFDTLMANLGGINVAGGKMKKEGATYWSSPNTLADNSFGFSAIGGGLRFDSGLFTANGLYGSFTTITSDQLNQTVYSVINTDLSLVIGYVVKSRGYSLRLIKA